MEVNLNCYDALALDLDGTIYVGDEIIEGAQETIYKLRSMGKNYCLFLIHQHKVE